MYIYGKYDSDTYFPNLSANDESMVRFVRDMSQQHKTNEEEYLGMAAASLKNRVLGSLVNYWELQIDASLLFSLYYHAYINLQWVNEQGHLNKLICQKLNPTF